MAESPNSLDANDFIVSAAPPIIRYIPNFIDEATERYLIQKVSESPKPKWQQLRNRQVQNWGGIVNDDTLIADGSIPKWLDVMIQKIVEVENTFDAGHRPNHVLVNEYHSGQGIMAHTDGPAFFPLISTISLGSSTLLDFFRPLGDEKNSNLLNRYIGSMLLEPRSLILIKDEAYQVMHGMECRTEDVIDENVFNLPEGMQPGTVMQRGTRISLTIRNVEKVNRMLDRSKIFGCVRR